MMKFLQLMSFYVEIKVIDLLGLLKNELIKY